MHDAFASDRETLAVAMGTMARQIFQHALGESSVEKVFGQQVQCERGVLRVAEDLYDLSAYSQVLVVSLGKAGHTMAEAMRGQTGDWLGGIVATPVEPASQVRGFRYFHGGHPLPNQESVRGAEAILKSLGTQGAASLVIFLVSGGGSSVVEKPVDEEISLEDLIATYRVLVHSGGTIAEINAIRKHLSAVKGGRLARAAYPAQQVSLLVSDVPDSALDALASGPTMPDSTTVKDCHAIAAKYGMRERFPAAVREWFGQAMEETPKPEDRAFAKSRWWPLLSNQAVVKHAAEEAARLSFTVKADNRCDDWDYAAAAEYLLEQARALRTQTGRVCLLSGGEVTVKVTQGGTGGRNQQFALACAQQIAGENITVLSAGTDGIDGNSPAAGALADGSTLERAKIRGLNASAAREKFDAYPFFNALGDVVMTGPTGNNLRDLRVVLAY